MNANISQIFVSKGFLDAYLYPRDKDLRIDNTDERLSKFIKILSGIK